MHTNALGWLHFDPLQKRSWEVPLLLLQQMDEKTLLTFSSAISVGTPRISCWKKQPKKEISRQSNNLKKIHKWLFGYVRIWVIQTNRDLFWAQACERCAEWQQALSLLDDTSLHEITPNGKLRCCNLVVLTLTFFAACFHVALCLILMFKNKASDDLQVEDMQIVVFGDVSAMHLCISACVKVHRCASCWSRSRCFLQKFDRQSNPRWLPFCFGRPISHGKLCVLRRDLCHPDPRFLNIDSHDSHGVSAKVPYFRFWTVPKLLSVFLVILQTPTVRVCLQIEGLEHFRLFFKILLRFEVTNETSFHKGKWRSRQSYDATVWSLDHSRHWEGLNDTRSIHCR